ncbi:MBL fold metallo-hydrolase, partial [Caldilinea sp.]|uniref:MBL fold metallo-hydrolase n=1 Tax=Caldilinea sp. TaxID=2293560 RepID=UPI002B7C716D|nr:MBL fold metallo-hydrolase [Caldilinea sp.]
MIRNATMKLTYAGTTFLIDPMLAVKGAYKGFDGTPRSELRNPLVDLPVPITDVLKADAIILSHIHEDHWDPAARYLVPRTMTIFTQDEKDAAKVREDGFTDVRVLTEEGLDFKGTRLIKTLGKHGSDHFFAVPQLAELLGDVMGIVFVRPNHPTAYVAGDTIWNKNVEDALTRYQPDVVFLNTGYAQVNGFDGSIIMGKDDVARAYRFSPKASIVGIHMESVNHAMLTRKELRTFIDAQKLDKRRVLV